MSIKKYISAEMSVFSDKDFYKVLLKSGLASTGLTLATIYAGLSVKELMDTCNKPSTGKKLLAAYFQATGNMVTAVALLRYLIQQMDERDAIRKKHHQ